MTEEIGLHNLKPNPGSRHRKKRIGRGEGSGFGKTSGRGHKGAGSRSGARQKVNFEGGQTPIHMRMRKLRGPHMKKSMPFEKFRTHTAAALGERRRARAEFRVRELMAHRFVQHVERRVLESGEFERLLDAIAARETDPYSVVEDIFKRAIR